MLQHRAATSPEATPKSSQSHKMAVNGALLLPEAAQGAVWMMRVRHSQQGQTPVPPVLQHQVNNPGGLFKKKKKKEKRETAAH